MTTLARVLHDELLARRARQQHLDWLLQSGVTPQAIVQAGGVGWCRARYHQGRFEFGGAVASFLLPARDGDHLVDLVAFDQDRPERMGTLYGRGWALGPDALNPNILGDDPDRLPPVAVWRSPLTWLRRGCHGLVILDWPEARYHLDHRDLVAEDADHGRQIRQQMQPPPWRGRVLVREMAA